MKPSHWLTIQGKAFAAQEQDKSKPAQGRANFDASPDNDKNPTSELDVAQRVATVGETVPVVFGKRVSGKGGIWVRPALVKSGSKLYVGRFLYVLSQGSIASNPAKITTWAGLRNLAFIDDQTITLAHNYSTAAALTSSPSTCPIQGNGLYCGIETYSYLDALIPATPTHKHVTRLADYTLQYQSWREICRGSGDTTNVGFEATLEVFDSETGADITTAYHAYLGQPTSTVYGFNQTLAYIGGNNAQPTLNSGEINDWLAYTISLGFDPLVTTGTSNSNFNAISGGRGAFTERWTIGLVKNPWEATVGACSGTFNGVQYERVVSNVANPDNATSANNTSYADITFLQVNGNIYEQQGEGSYPTTTKQLYTYYEQGVKVDLYSGGLSGGSYTNAASNQFIDLAMYLFTIYKQRTGASNADIVAPVKLTNLQGLCTFCTTYGLTFNGVISQAVNIIEFVSSVAPFYLLSFISNGGQYQFAPVLPLTGGNAIDLTTLSPTLSFTEDNILPGTFQKGYLSLEDRRDFIASCVYRTAEPTDIGLQKTVLVKYPNTSIDAPLEQFEMVGCTDPAHAVIYAKYELARRKLSTHNISFSTPLLTTTLIPTNIIKITRQRKSSTEHADRQEVEWYQVTKVNHTASGETQIEASHFPVHGSSISSISNEVVNGTFTTVT